MSLLELHDVRYGYAKNRRVLRGIDAEFEAGKLYSIVGPSGCGKTTLLSLLGGLDSPSEGSIICQGTMIGDGISLAAYRKKHVAFVFQSYNLIDYMTPVENVALASRLPGLPVLEKLGLTREEAKRNVLKLSGGQQQRVAIARALASDSEILLADEPTGNLDEDTASEIMAILLDSAHQSGKCVVMVTHSSALARQGDSVLRLRRGVLS